MEDSENGVYCIACGEEFVPSSVAAQIAGGDPYSNFVVAVVLSVDAIPKQKELKKVMVDIRGDGDEGTAVQIVTNAKYVEAGWKVVVALENAVVPAGASLEDDSNAVQVKACAVGGVMSRGMLCDSPMLAWTGGAKGVVQQLPDTFAVGDKPPSSRPRV